MQNGKYFLDQSGPLEGTRVADMTRLAAGISPPERWTKILPISTRWESRSARFVAWPISSITRLFAAAASSKISRTRNTVRSRYIQSSRDSARRRAPAPILGDHSEDVLQLLSRSIEDYRQIKGDSVVWRDTLLPQSSNQCPHPLLFQ